jgi:signal transduction histidine kinase
VIARCVVVERVIADPPAGHAGTGAGGRPRWWPLALIPAGWLLAALASSARGGMMIVDGVARPMAWGEIFRGALYDYAWWMVLAPLVVLGVRGIDRARLRGAGRAVAHLVFAAATAVAYWLLRSRVPLPGAELGLSSALAGLESSLPSSLAVHVILVAGSMASAAQQRVRLREREAGQLHTALVEAKLGALRSQLHPHFLFNALHAVSTLIDVDPAGARRALVQLSEVLRMAVDFSERETVPLTREIEWIEHYLDLQAMRFGDRLTFDLRTAPEAVGAVVPPLIVQPLVENAIKHGVERRAAGGHVCIEAAVRGGRLRIRVVDDGPGIAPARDGASGVGLPNVRARLAALYGAEATLRLFDRADAPGAEALIELPLRHGHGA